MSDPVYLTALELRDRTTSAELAALPNQQLETHYIVPAERRIFARYGFELDTESLQYKDADDNIGAPIHLRWRFIEYEADFTRFKDDMQTATILLIERMVANPTGLKAESIGGGAGSATFGRDFPAEVAAILNQWKNPRRANRVLRG